MPVAVEGSCPEGADPHPQGPGPGILLPVPPDRYRSGARRCPWAESSDLMRAYHDTEWGVPSRDDRHLFEMLVLEGAQAGLSWATILNKRARYREVFRGFDPHRVAAYGQADIDRLLADPGIVRNRLKVRSAVANAQAFVAVQDEHGSFAEYVWAWVDGRTIVHRPRTMGQLPARTPLSDRLSKDLKRRGFSFVGTTIVYSFLQSVGLVDDHLVTCPSKGVGS
jgi:DNA-3-methyladenine glycosylase I